MGTNLTEDQALGALAAAVVKAGSQAAFGAQYNITPSLVGMVLRGERSLSKPILDAIGLECIERKTYRRKPKPQPSTGAQE